MSEAKREDSYRKSLQEGRGVLISLFNPIRKWLGLGMHVDFESMISECGLEIELTKKIRSGHRTLFICGNPHSNEIECLIKGFCDQGVKRPFKSDTPFGQAYDSVSVTSISGSLRIVHNRGYGITTIRSII